MSRIFLPENRDKLSDFKAVETAKSMLSLGLPLDQIQLCTSLPLETVLELAQTK